MPDQRNATSRALEGAEVVFNVIALAFCWTFALRLVGLYRHLMSASQSMRSDMTISLHAGDLHSISVDLVATAMAPGFVVHLVDFGGAVLAAVVAAVLLFSAAEGTWWLIRKTTL